MPRLAIALLCVLATATPVGSEDPDGVQQLLQRLERVLQAGDHAGLALLFQAPDPDVVEQHARTLFAPDATRIAVRERARLPPEAANAAQGWQVAADIFIETRGTARIVTVVLDVVAPSGPATHWSITTLAGAATFDDLYRLHLDADGAFDGRDFTVFADDLQLRLQQGIVVPVVCDAGITALVLVGRGEMAFTPTPPAEQGQLRLFSGRESLITSFETAFVRMNPADRTWQPSVRVPVRPDARQLARAQQVFSRESPKSFTLDLGGLSPDMWHLLPTAGDLLAEVATRRHGTLTYSRAGTQMEDVSLFHRERRLTIALYASETRLAARSRVDSTPAMRAFDVSDYDIHASIDPVGAVIAARVRMRVRVSDPALPHLSLHLAEPLAVTEVVSAQHGPLLHVRLTGHDTVLVGLPRRRDPDTMLTLTLTYEGRLPSEALGRESLQVGSDGTAIAGAPATEPYYLLTGRSRWYPQAPVPGTATATLHVAVPAGHRAIATGEPVTRETATLHEWLALAADEGTFIFRARRPVRYLGVVVSRFVPAAAATMTFGPAAGPERDTLAISVDTTRAQQARGRVAARQAEDIVRFYVSLLGSVPYPSLTVALLESPLPGGHSPGYVIALNEPVPQARLSWREDPAYFDRYPEYFLAHEIAHQWWGQAVGWRNYREQWISEGFAQYFAALYAESAHPPRVFAGMLAQFRRSALSHARGGPIHLGQRVGHIGGDPRVHRAIVYNKGAAVLHMLRRLMGDERFTTGLRNFYEEFAFSEAGTDDVRRTFEAVSGLDLEAFFEGWVYGSDIPRLQYSTTIEEDRVIVRFRQRDAIRFDFPITITLVHPDRTTEDVIVRVTERATEHVIPASGRIRQVEINRDDAALVELSRMR